MPSTMRAVPATPALWLLMTIALAMSGCAGPAARRYEDPAARLLAAEKVPPGADAFKGVGRLRLLRDGGATSGRAAWVAAPPDRLRMELLYSAGPAAKVATDGQWLYIVSHADGGFYRRRGENPSLSRLVSVPMGIEALISLLSGRLPIPGFHRAWTEGHGGAVALQRWAKVVARLYPDESGRRVAMMERFNASENLQWRARLSDWRKVAGGELPFRIGVTDGAGDGFELTIERCWPAPDVDPAIFTLSPP